MEQSHEKKISQHNERERDLQQKLLELEQRHEETLQALKAEHETLLTNTVDDYENQLHEERMYGTQLTTEKEDIIREFEETKRQLEEDADREIEELKDEYAVAVVIVVGTVCYSLLSFQYVGTSANWHQSARRQCVLRRRTLY